MVSTPSHPLRHGENRRLTSPDICSEKASIFANISVTAWLVTRLPDAIERMSDCTTVSFPLTLCSRSRTTHSVRATVSLISSRLPEILWSSDVSWVEFCCTWIVKSASASFVASDATSSRSTVVLMVSIPSPWETSDFLPALISHTLLLKSHKDIKGCPYREATLMASLKCPRRLSRHRRIEAISPSRNG